MPPAGPLDGIRVLDLTSVVMGPLATQILGDLGADVITVENCHIAALFHRERTGAGQRVEVPMTDAMLAFVLVEHGGAAMCRPAQGSPAQGSPALGSPGYQRILTPLRGALQTADGWIAVQPYREEHWAALLRAAGIDELIGDPRLQRRSIWRNPGFAYATLSRILATKTTAQWLEICAGLAIPAGAAADLDELIDELPDGEHPDAGRYKVIPPPVRFSATPASVRRPAPLIGQHTREVLAEAGLDEAQISSLAAAGVLRHGPSSADPRSR